MENIHNHSTVNGDIKEWRNLQSQTMRFTVETWVEKGERENEASVVPLRGGLFQHVLPTPLSSLLPREQVVRTPTSDSLAAGAPLGAGVFPVLSHVSHRKPRPLFHALR